MKLSYKVQCFEKLFDPRTMNSSSSSFFFFKVSTFKQVKQLHGIWSIEISNTNNRKRPVFKVGRHQKYLILLVSQEVILVPFTKPGEFIGVFGNDPNHAHRVPFPIGPSIRAQIQPTILGVRPRSSSFTFPARIYDLVRLNSSPKRVRDQLGLGCPVHDHPMDNLNHPKNETGNWPRINGHHQNDQKLESSN